MSSSMKSSKLLVNSPFLSSSSNNLHKYQATQQYKNIDNNYHNNEYNFHNLQLSNYKNSPYFDNNIKNNNNEKYFPKQLIQILPGKVNYKNKYQQNMSNSKNNLCNTISVQTATKKKIYSPFYRAKLCNSQEYKNIEQINDKNKLKSNPFHKKYLLTQKNDQLQNYINTNNLHDILDHNTNNNINVGQSQNKKFIQQQMGSGMLRLAKKYGQINQMQYNLPLQSTQQIKNLQKYTNQNNYNYNYNNNNKNIQANSLSSQYRAYNAQDYKNIKANSLSSQYRAYNPQDYKNIQRQYIKQRQINKYDQYADLIQSDIDQKQFDSFGKGKEKPNNIQKYDYKDMKSYSIINGLDNMIDNDENINCKQITQDKRKPVYFDSDDDSRKSGTFRIPDSLIDQINKTKQIQNKNLNINKSINLNNQNINISKSINLNNQKLKISVNNNTNIKSGNPQRTYDYTQNKQYPEKIIKKGKTYQKISL